MFWNIFFPCIRIIWNFGYSLFFLLNKAIKLNYPNIEYRLYMNYITSIT